MVIWLTRTYFPEGTNGKLECEGKLICNTIELPWKMNETRVSCIPEGKYFIRKRYSSKYKWHFSIIRSTVCKCSRRIYDISAGRCIIPHNRRFVDLHVSGCRIVSGTKFL
ncbi:DUF5675 family protein [Flavobacterium sp. NRK F10]|uniref:DUF5675 family protein n=1 Tax=Flavobacterium sp. NRK F10 TaxID=2954931 RepID=UPI0027E2C825|nr:DUF5675 family protein [Flavobacterium sp. NRK F10]